MRRAFAGPRAARVRPAKGVRITIVAAGALLLAACGPATEDAAFEPSASAVVTTATPTTATPAPATSAGSTPSATPSPTRTATPKPVAPKVVVPRPVVSKPAPVRTTAPRPAPKPAPACHPSYAGACLDPGASDYDCAGGKGNGPLYTGRVTVVGPDVFDLDRDGDGVGCEDA